MQTKCPFFLTLVMLIAQAHFAIALRNYSFEELLPCQLSSLNLSLVGSTEIVEPCILYDVKPVDLDNSTSVIPMVQVTPTNCLNHRDGAFTAIQKLNTEGVPLGFDENHKVKVSFISIIAGNPTASTPEEYALQHAQILRIVLESTGAPYIIGTCSFSSEAEKAPAADYQAILMAQVGPPSFYYPENSNPYVFGFHINSDDYPLPNMQELAFLKDTSTPIRVVYRSQSEFFLSTCESALKRAQSDGYTDIKAIMFDPAQDQDLDGEVNELDADFLESIADQACPPDRVGLENPAIFLCTLTEHDAIIQRWLDTRCRPQSLWVTAATWPWADDNPDLRPFLQGGAQWHEKFDYSDRFFESGKELLEYNQALFGYKGTYDQVVSYAIPVLFSQHLQAAYRVTDEPDPLFDFSNADGRERLRRAMVVLTAETIFGPVAFNEYQRNIGRGSAGTQWLPDSSTANGGSVNRLVSPSLQAEESTVIPAFSALPCSAGSYVNASAWAEGGSVLASGCEFCPVDTFAPEPTSSFQCKTCPENTNTNGLSGSETCFLYEDNLLSTGILAFGYATTGLSWALALGFLIWLFKHRNDPVVKVSQVEFLVLICLGTIICSSTVIALTRQAGTDEDTSAATAGCMAAPFLYTIGWILQYSSLSAKTYRLYHTMQCTKRMQRVSITAAQMIPIVVVCLLIDVTIVTVWTIMSPLEYERIEESRQVNEETGIVTISSVGRCVSSDGTFWHFAGPIVGFHLLMIIGTNVLLCQVRDIADRYQEQKYVAMASALMLEILLVGVPVLVSVQDNVSATFIVFTAIIALDDIAVLCCIFGPKVNFQRKGLEQGIQFGESILRETHRRATLREFSRREMTNSQVNESLNMSGMDNKSDSEDSKKYSLGQRRETNSSRPPQSKSSGSTPAKFSGSSSLLQESIAEETSSDIRRELAPEDHSSNNWESVLSSESNPKQSVGSNPCSTSENISTHSSGGD